jgi:uncharacterized membrane protein YadS
LNLFKTEDYWAIWLGMIVIALSVGFFWEGSTLKPWAVTPGTWSDLGQLTADLGEHFLSFVLIFLGFGLVFAISMRIMGRNQSQFLAGYTILFLGSLAIFYLAGWSVVKKMDLGAPLLALLVGLIIGNIKAAPEWFKTSLRTEYYIKTGIVLLGATLPLTLIAEAGPIAFVQATIVSIVTWLVIYLAATRIFELDPRFGAVLGTGGAVCGVSGSIAVGGAVKADKDHIAIGIAVVSVWAIVMIFILAFLTKWMIPAGGGAMTQWYQISPGEAGAWVGTSEYADAAGFAVVAELATHHGDAPIHAFTLMKVIGRDIEEVASGGGAPRAGRDIGDMGEVPQVRARLLRSLGHHEPDRSQPPGGLRRQGAGFWHLQVESAEVRVRRGLLELPGSSGSG